MKKNQKKIKIGLLGCGAIGSRLAKSIKADLKTDCMISGIYDQASEKSRNLIKTLNLSPSLMKTSLADLLLSSDFIIEAIASKETSQIIRKIICARKDILIMSAGAILNTPSIFRIAKKNRTAILIPSGAISGLDVIKSIKPSDISRVTLTTRKPITGIHEPRFAMTKRSPLTSLKNEVLIFEGSVDNAVKLFPQNINVAATVALAMGTKRKIRVRIITSPDFTLNSHEIEVKGKFGHFITRAHNVICPDNPKTSFLAVFSAIQTLKQFFSTVKIGT